ncbi:MAG: DUF4249 domain-containing protein [Cyclobacteriaceae bacterium]
MKINQRHIKRERQMEKRYLRALSMIFALIWCALPSCIETFELDYVLESDAIVVTGLITDKAPAYVELTAPAATPISGLSAILRISGASITLVEDTGGREQLTEVRNGYYEGQTPGVVGRSYFVEIVLPDDRLIVSTPQQIKPNPSIDRLYTEQVSTFRSFGGGVEFDYRGLNLNVYLNREDTVSRYYRWIVGGSYEFYSALDSENENGPCYYTIPQLPSFNVGESASANADIISKRLKFITPNSTYAFGHSVELVQYSQTKESYDYWKKIEDQQRNVGSIFDPPPAQITGNLNFDDGEKGVVMGFFEAASVKNKRIFLNRDSFTNLDPSIDYFSDTGINAPCYPPPGWTGPWNPPDWCFDCALLENSTRTKPLYWPN